jgi:DNA-binding CsgD family transcriptional regulator
MGNAAVLFLFIFLFGLGMLGVAATGMAAFRGTRPYLVPLFLFSVTWSLGILVITFHYFLYVYVEERLRIDVPFAYAIYGLNALGAVFLLRALHRFADLRRPLAEAALALAVAAGAASTVALGPAAIPAAAKALPSIGAMCAVITYAAAVLVRNRPRDRAAAVERAYGLILLALLIATAAIDYFLELSRLHPLTADHFAFAAWNSLVLSFLARRWAYRRKNAPAETALDRAETRFKLSPRERETLEGILRGWSNKRIAQELSIEETTVKTYVASLFQKCGAASRYELMSKFK